MLGWPLIAVVVTSAGTFLLLLLFLIRRFCCRPQKPHPIEPASSLQHGISKLHHQGSDFHHRRRTNYYVFQRGVSSKPLFNWSDNPSLITDAVENGWSRFAFASNAASPSLQPNRSLLGYCAAAASGSGGDVEIVWEVCQGSADFMQKIRLNPGSKKTTSTTSSMAAAAVIKSALPLPGPALGNPSPFPQEAYFEITILSSFDDEHDGDVEGKTGVKKAEGEKIKLIQVSPGGENVKSESLLHMNSNGVNVNRRGGSVKLEELRGRSASKAIVEGKNEVNITLSVGLAGGGSLPLKLPGSYPGSVGFNSDGTVYLDGVKLASECESEHWAKAERVIGCGYNPSEKRVFFTSDSKLVYEIHCKGEEFATPLYPTLAANGDVTVLVNLGQSVFKYAAANQQRTTNPCFIGDEPPALGLEDSRELFSMGRIDSHWLERSTKRSAQHNRSVNRGTCDYDDVSEGDLFEIVLDSDSRGRSPSTYL